MGEVEGGESEEQTILRAWPQMQDSSEARCQEDKDVAMWECVIMLQRQDRV